MGNYRQRWGITAGGNGHPDKVSVFFLGFTIIAAAVNPSVLVLLTEDLKNGQIVEDVMIKNPFI